MRPEMGVYSKDHRLKLERMNFITLAAENEVDHVNHVFATCQEPR